MKNVNPVTEKITYVNGMFSYVNSLKLNAVIIMAVFPLFGRAVIHRKTASVNDGDSV